MDSALDAKLSSVLGGRTAAALYKAFGLSTVADLLGHYPRRYARRGELTALSELEVDENVTIVAEVVSVSERKMRAKHGSILEARISDEQFAQKMAATFEDDFVNSRLMTVEEVENKPVWFRALSRLSYLAAPIQ